MKNQNQVDKTLHKYQSMNHFLEEVSQQYSDLPAFTHLGTTLSYRILNEFADKFSQWLCHNKSVQHNDRIGIVLPNIVQFPVAVFGALKAGLTIVPINPIAGKSEIDYLFSHSDLTAVIFLDLFENYLNAANDKFPQITWIRCGLGDFKSDGKRQFIQSWTKYLRKDESVDHVIEAFSFRDILQGDKLPRIETESAKPGDLAMLQYTQGITGQKKAAMLNHGNLVANMLQLTDWFNHQHIENQSTQDVVIAPMPLFYSYGFMAHCLCMLELGKHNILIADPTDIRRFIKTLKFWDFAIIVGINSLFQLLLRQKSFHKLDFKNLRLTLSAGSFFNNKVSEKWKSVTGCDITNAYGLSEASAAVAVHNYDIPVTGSVGCPLLGTQVKIMNSSLDEVKTGEVGEIHLSGPQVFAGYWNSVDQTAMTLVDGWLKTGDLAYQDDDGNLFIVDRLKDVLHVSNFIVYPKEIENVAARFPGVVNCAAIGIPEGNNIERIHLVIVVDDNTLDVDELQRYCRSNLSGYKVPKSIEIREELPLSFSGIIRKNELRKDVLKKLGSSRL